MPCDVVYIYTHTHTQDVREPVVFFSSGRRAQKTVNFVSAISTSGFGLVTGILSLEGG